MGKIVVSTNVSLDGISEDPTGEEGFKFGGWSTRMTDADREAWTKTEFEEALGAEALLLGGRATQASSWSRPSWSMTSWTRSG